MSPCTLWFRYVNEERLRPDPWDFNHLEDGHAAVDRPTPKHADQARSWARAQWQRVHAWLTDELPARVVHYSPEEA